MQQVFAAEDASTADAEQAAEEKLQLTSGRRDAWDRQQAQAAFELSDRVEQLRSQVCGCNSSSCNAKYVGVTIATGDGAVPLCIDASPCAQGVSAG